MQYNFLILQFSTSRCIDYPYRHNRFIRELYMCALIRLYKHLVVDLKELPGEGPNLRKASAWSGKRWAEKLEIDLEKSGEQYGGGDPMPPCRVERHAPPLHPGTPTRNVRGAACACPVAAHRDGAAAHLLWWLRRRVALTHPQRSARGTAVCACSEESLRDAYLGASEVVDFRGLSRVRDL
ncbi:Protein of unknown function, partial [Gryllus bimaculatus]